MPFRWTINPYRGCTHACVYCSCGRHADPAGRRPHADRSPTSRPATRSTAPAVTGRYRRYVHDRGARALVDDQAGVPRHARGRDRAGHERRPPLPHRARLEARHRPTGGPLQRPHLTIEQRADGHGRLRRCARRTSADYRRGYLCGIDPRRRAPGSDGPRPPRTAHRGRTTGSDWRSPTSRRCARTRDVPRPDSASPTGEFAFSAPHGRPRAEPRDPNADAGRKSSASTSSSGGRCRRATTGARASWRASSTLRGRPGEASLRIANTDRAIVDWTAACLEPLRLRPRRGRRAARERPAVRADARRPVASACASST